MNSLTCSSVLAWSLFLLPALLATEPMRSPQPNPIIEVVKSKVKDANKPFTLAVKLTAPPKNRDQVIEAFTPAIATTRKEKGCLRYELNLLAETEDGNDVFLLYERWESVDALDAHLKTEHITKLLGTVGPLFAKGPEVKVLLPVAE